jgi:hypothetical protein
MQALAELWGRGGKGFAAAQQGMLFDMAERMVKAQEGELAAPQAIFFDSQGLSSASEAFLSSRHWSELRHWFDAHLPAVASSKHRRDRGSVYKTGRIQRRKC